MPSSKPGMQECGGRPTSNTKLKMDIKKINEFMSQSRWTDMLKELTPGKHILPCPSVDAIRSCKAIAYSLNSDRKGRRYTFHVDKAKLSVTINVEEYGND